MTCIDSTDAYYSVLIALSGQKYLYLQSEGLRYKYVCMSNGLFFAHRFFKKLVKPVSCSLRKQGHQAMNYLDDFFLVGDNFEECLKALEDSLDLLSRLGFQKSIGKSVFMSTQKIEDLGFTLSSKDMTVTLNFSVR